MQCGGGNSVNNVVGKRFVVYVCVCVCVCWTTRSKHWTRLGVHSVYVFQRFWCGVFRFPQFSQLNSRFNRCSTVFHLYPFYVVITLRFLNVFYTLISCVRKIVKAQWFGTGRVLVLILCCAFQVSTTDVLVTFVLSNSESRVFSRIVVTKITFRFIYNIFFFCDNIKFSYFTFV